MVKLKLLQWNANGLMARLIEFKNYLAASPTPPDIICLQEVKVAKTKQIKINGYSVEYKPRITDDRHGGLAIAIRAGISYSNVSTPDDIELMAIQIEVDNTPHSIINHYITPTTPLTKLPDHLKGLTDILQNSSHHLIMGDINAYSYAWGADHTDAKGNAFDDYISESDLCVLNDGRGTHVTQHGTLTPIDVTLASSNIALKCSWDLHSNSMGSDHLPIIVELGCTASVFEITAIARYKLNKANWQSIFQRYILTQ